MTVVGFETAILVFLAVAGDARSCKIKNSLVLPFLAAGLVTNLLLSGASGLVRSVSGAAIPFALLFALYALRMLGAGDVKLFCAIGSIAGSRFILHTLVCSFLSGGVIALAVLLTRRNAGERVRCLLSYLKACFLSRSLLPYADAAGKSVSAKFRFSYAIAVGTAITSCLHIAGIPSS